MDRGPRAELDDLRARARQGRLTAMKHLFGDLRVHERRGRTAALAPCS